LKENRRPIEKTDIKIAKLYKVCLKQSGVIVTIAAKFP